MGEVHVLSKIYSTLLVLACLAQLFASKPSFSQAFVSFSLPDDGCVSRRRRRSMAFWNSKHLLGNRNSDERPPSRSGDLYSSDQLMSLLHVHSVLSTKTFSSSSQSNATASAIQDSKMSLHDLILLETSSPRLGNAKKTTTNNKLSAPSNNYLQPSLIDKLSQTRMIASDVDGTLLTSDHDLHPRTRQALYRVLEAVHPENYYNNKLKYFCLATGKTRAGALASIYKADPQLGEALSMVPGVFIQGLFCVDGATRRVLWEERLKPDPVLAVERQAAKWNVTLFAYRRDEIFASSFSHSHHITELHELWGEPQPQVISSFENLQPDNGPGFVNKLLLMDSDVERLASTIRPALEAIAAEYGCVVTQAVPTMLEVLPPGCSKATGVLQLCRALQIDSTSELVAIGDAENDVGMLDMAAVGFAVGNAVPEARKAADVWLKESNNMGGAGVAIELVLEQTSW